MERDAIDWSLKYVDGISVEVKPEHKAHLLIEVDGSYPEILIQEAEKNTLSCRTILILTMFYLLIQLIRKMHYGK